MMAVKIGKREREANWSQQEKDVFRELISKHVAIINDKRNDMNMIEKKKKGWESIRSDMEAAGYYREATKLKQQWMRIKAHAKSNLAAARKARTSTGNCTAIPELDYSDEEVINMINVEVLEDNALIDSNSEPQIFSQAENSQSWSQFDKQLTQPEERFEEQLTHPEQSVEEQHSQQHECQKQQRNQLLVNKLRKLPKPVEKCNVLKERMQQIQEETKNNKEIHKAQIEKIRAEVIHEKELHDLHIRHLKELHELKKQILLKQIKNSNENI